MKKIIHRIQVAYARLMNRFTGTDVLFIPMYLANEYDISNNAVVTAWFGKYVIVDIAYVPEEVRGLVIHNYENSK